MTDNLGERSLPPEAQVGWQLQVLMVDDQALKLNLRAMQVGASGGLVTKYSTPEQALADFEEDPTRYDAVFTDLEMPNLDGGELAERIKQKRPDIPIVMMSGNNFSDEQRKKLTEKGIDIFLEPTSKLAEIKQTLTNVGQLIQQRHDSTK